MRLALLSLVMLAAMAAASIAPPVELMHKAAHKAVLAIEGIEQ